MLGSDTVQLSSLDQGDNGQNFITVIPVDYPPRSYHHDFPPGHVARDYLREKVREELRQSLDQLNKDHENSLRDAMYPARPPAPFHDEPLTSQNAVQSYISRGTSDARTEDKYTSDTPASFFQQSKKVEVLIFTVADNSILLDVEDIGRMTVTDYMNTLVEEEEVNLSELAKEVFTMWMTSKLLDIQMKPFHRPLIVRRKWPDLLMRFCDVSPEESVIDDPRLTLKRNCFFPKREEVKIRDQKILELLYEEAKQNILDGRYPCEVSDYEMLAGLQARLELGVYDPQVHTPEFFRSRLSDFLPDHVSHKHWVSLLIKSKSSPELRILDQYRRIPLSTSRRKLVRKYLEFCWSLPYYGSAFFHGQIEQPPKGLLHALFTRKDLPVVVAINGDGVFVIDPEQCVAVLGLKYSELSWDFAKPFKDNDPDCLPCLFLQFAVVEGGMRVSKMLQVFSRQAVMMDALISSHVEEIRRRAALYGDDVDGAFDGSTDVDDVLIPLTTVSRKEVPNSCLSNKFDRLAMATFNEDGECISKMGSWSFVQ